MPNLLDLYKHYLLTQDKETLFHIANSAYSHSLINNCYKLNYNPDTKSFAIERDDIINSLYIRLCDNLHTKDYHTKEQLLAYIKLTLVGIIKDEIRRTTKLSNKVFYTSNIDDYDTATADAYFTEEEKDHALIAFIKEHVYLYESVYNQLSIRDIAKKYNVTKWHVETQLKASKAAAKVFLTDRQKNRE